MGSMVHRITISMRTAMILGVCAIALFSFGARPSVANNSAGERAAAGGPPTLVIIGASYAAGWKPKVPGFRVVNRGVSGEQTHEMLARFDRDVLAEQPAAVLIWGHINNIHRGPRDDMDGVRSRARADYTEMIRRARERNVTVLLATEVTLTEIMSWTDNILGFVAKLRGKQGYAARVNAQVKDINGWLRATARDQKIALLDLERALDDGEGARLRAYTTDDGSHISAAGYAALDAYAAGQWARLTGSIAR
jgi:lysophospholipase L1-like esterase